MCFCIIFKYIKLLQNIIIIHNYKIFFVATYYFIIWYIMNINNYKPKIVSPTNSCSASPILKKFLYTEKNVV